MIENKTYQIDPVQDFLSSLKREKSIAYSSLLAFERDLIRLQIWANIAGKQIHELSTEDLRDWIEHLRRSRQSPVIIERTIRLIRSLFKFLLTQGYINADPTIDLDAFKSNKQLPKLLSEDEVERLVAALDDVFSSSFDQVTSTEEADPTPLQISTPIQPSTTTSQPPTILVPSTIVEPPTVKTSAPLLPIDPTTLPLEQEEIAEPVIPVQKVQRRRHPRIPLVIRIGLEGLSTTGHHFQIEAETVLVSRCGATVLANVKVEPGSTIYITLPEIERIRAQVTGVRFDKKDKRQLIGVKLINPRTWLGN
jgi:hypothetical protein